MASVPDCAAGAPGPCGGGVFGAADGAAPGGALGDVEAGAAVGAGAFVAGGALVGEQPIAIETNDNTMSDRRTWDMTV